MKQLRKIIRKILVESSWDTRSKIVIAIDDYTKHITKNNPNKRSVHLDDNKDSRSLRRLSKILWNKFADHEFFANDIYKLHSLSYGRELGDISHYLRNDSHKNELSCVGIGKSGSEAEAHNAHYRRKIKGLDRFTGIHMVLGISGRTTWAGDFDGFTEEIGKATQAQFEFHKSSGIPKRIGSIRDIGADIEFAEFADLIILDDNDLTRSSGKSPGKIEEMVVDNWKINTVYISLSSNWIDIMERTMPASGNEYHRSHQGHYVAKYGTAYAELIKINNQLKANDLKLILHLGMKRVSPKRFIQHFEELLQGRNTA